MYEVAWIHLHGRELHENSQKPCTNSLVQNHIECPKQGLFGFMYNFYNVFSITIDNV